MPSPQRISVFLSSASGALASYRAAAVEVCQRLGLQPVHMEEFPPERPPPREVCRKRVAESDVFVLLIAHRYGARPTGETRSYTELEYDWALERPELPLLPFVVEPDFPWKPSEVGGADSEALAAFVGRVKKAHHVKRFGDLDRFREDLLIALSEQQRSIAGGRAAEAGRNDREGDEPVHWVPPAPAFHAMPAYVGSAPFTGRRADLDTLDAWGASADPVMVVEAIGGNGKSALTWEWAQKHAPDVIPGLAGRLWWSFYDRSASITRFLQEVLAYTGTPMTEVRRLGRTELADRALAALRVRPFLLVLDGFERLLAAYHRFDPSKLRDDEVDAAQRSLIEGYGTEVVRALCSAGPSKVLISSRLMPEALDTRFGRPLPGVSHLRLPGLTDSDTVTLLGRLGVTGSPDAFRGFFGKLDNHPLLIGIVAGLVNDYRPAGGSFDRWLADPTAGGGLALPTLDLTQRRTHILDAAFAGLPDASRQLLGWISVLSGSVDWETIEAINPFRPDPPPAPEPDLAPLGPEPDDWPAYGEWQDAVERLQREAAERHREAWRASPQGVAASAALVDALRELENRGLLWWDRAVNAYDLHPIVRAYAHDQLAEPDRIRANDRVHDHFQALPPEDPKAARSVEDLRQTITLFRSLVGAGRTDEASGLWVERLSEPLRVALGVGHAVVELLAPLAETGSHRLRSDLAGGYHDVSRNQEASELQCALVSESLARPRLSSLYVELGNLAITYFGPESRVIKRRYRQLAAAAERAVNGDTLDGWRLLGEAMTVLEEGDIPHALVALDQAERAGGVDFSWFADELTYGRALAAFHLKRLTWEELKDAAAPSTTWHYRRQFAALRFRLAVRESRWQEALQAADEHDRLSRDAGFDLAPTRQAFALAKLGRDEDAAAALRVVTGRSDAKDGSYWTARALQALGRLDEAIPHALAFYRESWADGPPHCDHWDLQDARQLLSELGVPEPELPVVDPDTVTVPLEAEILAAIAELAAEREAESRQSPD